MTDKEMLELAAKAAGYIIESYTADGGAWVYEKDAPANGDGEPPIFKWHPREDDGDALRLAVKLNLQVTPGTYRADEATAYRAGHAEANERIHYQQDLLSATRRAIVRAAAEIGRAMK